MQSSAVALSSLASSLLCKMSFLFCFALIKNSTLITAGIAFSKINRQLGLIVAMAGECVILLTYPFQNHVYFFYGAEMINAFFGAIIDVACISWMLDMWPEKANTFQLILNAAGAVGGTVSPFLVTPFLSVREETVQGNMTNATTDPLVHIVQESRIVIPYSITAAIHLIAAITLFSLFLSSPYKQNQKDKQEAAITGLTVTGVRESRNSPCEIGQHQERPHRLDEGSNRKKDQTVTIIAGTVMYIFYANSEVNALNYLPQFLVSENPSISKQSAALIGSTFNAVYALTFGITIFVSTKVRVIHMLFAYFLLISCGNVLLACFVKTSTNMTWIAVVTLGAGHSSMLSGIFSFLEERVDMSDRIVGIMISVYALTMILNTLTLGQFVESFPLSYVYVNLSCISVSFIVLVGLTFSGL